MVHRLASTLLVAASLAACAAPAPLTAADYRARLPALEARAAAAPTDADAQRDFGEALAQTGAFARAREVLHGAEALAPGDSRTRYYQGVAAEGLGDRPSALAAYAAYATAPRLSPYRRLMAGRHAWLLRETVRDELRALLAAEDSGAAGFADGVTEAVAVFPLRFLGGDSLYRPLGRGLSEMLTVDLASVDGVRVVERVRLQALLDELAVGRSGAFDAATVPRAGRLLRSGRVVGGALAVEGGVLRTDVGVWAWPSQPAPGLRTRQAGLEDLFRLEKEIVFGLLDDLGVELTAAQRAEVERVPTQNLQAFLAYSRGLLDEDAGRFGAAAAHFTEAARLDPGFAEAGARAEAAADLATVAGGVETALMAASTTGRRAPASGLVGNRLTLLNASLGGAVVPGEDARDPTAEGSVAPPGAVSYPDPPAPPPGRSGN